MSNFNTLNTNKLCRPVAQERVDPGACHHCRVGAAGICSLLADIDIHALGSSRSIVRCSAGAVLIDEGDLARHVFNVVEGAVQVFKLLPDGRRQITGIFFAGDLLGLTNSERYDYGAVAAVETLLCRIPRAALEKVIEKAPKAMSGLLAISRNEVAAAYDHILLLGRKNSRERLASLLLLLSERLAPHHGDLQYIPLPMSRSDVGDYLGLTSETVSRAMSQLKRDGIIAPRPGGRIEIRDRELLRTIAIGERRGAERARRKGNEPKGRRTSN